jgi:3-phenylpropionate/trans-cinnamate dioxygenase ferredoxin reductase component
MMMQLDRIVIVGGSLGGLRAAQTLRGKGFAGAIAVIGEETAAAYNRPPLSKAVLRGDMDLTDVLLDAPDSLDIEWRRGSPATALDLRSRILKTAQGDEISWDGLVLATGVKPRIPSIPGVCLEGVHFLRTFEDAKRLREDLRPGARLTIIGAGFIGCEIAASARALGLEVTVVDPAERPLSRVLAPELAASIAELHRTNGVEFRLQRSVTSISGAERAMRVVLDDGTSVPSDVIVVGVGSIPAADWLRGSGLEVADGVLCDETCRALGGDGRVVAAGDVANWPHEGYGGRRMRVEHWSQAGEQAEAAATALLQPDWNSPFRPVLSLWSDQYDRKLQVLGAPWLGDRTKVTQGSLNDTRFFAECFDGERLVGVVAMNMPGKIAGARRRIEASMTPPGSAAAERVRGIA